MRILDEPHLLLTMIGFYSLLAYLVVVAVLLVWWPRSWLVLFTLFFGMLAGFLDLHGDSPQFPALLLLAGGFFAASLRSERPWVWPLLLGPSIPLVGLWKTIVLGTPLIGVLGGLIAFIPAFLGAGLGALVAWGRTRLRLENSTISI